MNNPRSGAAGRTRKRLDLNFDKIKSEDLTRGNALKKASLRVRSSSFGEHRFNGARGLSASVDLTVRSPR